MKKCTHIGIRKARLRARLASTFCAHFDYRHQRSLSWDF